MARATRSKKVEIAEDSTALTPGVQTLPLPDTHLQIQPLDDVAGNTMADASVETQLKELKAAFRVAIGEPKKNKKGKNKKKGKVQQESGDASIIENNGAIGRADKQENSEGTLTTSMDRLSLRDCLTHMQEDNFILNSEDSTEQHKAAQPYKNAKVAKQQAQPAVRTTRRQAKAQEGPYDDLLASILGGKNSSSLTEPHREIDFVTSLFAGRHAGPSRSFNNSVSGLSRSLPRSGCTANDYLFLAEEVLRKAAREATHKETITVPEESILSPAEPAELNENPEVQQAPQSPTKSAALSANTQTEDGDQDSFIEQITCRSPAKPVTRGTDSLDQLGARSSQSTTKSTANPVNEKAATQDHDDEDSFLEQIKSRSPAKQMSRIEDSVEALDQMEEVEEALHEAAMAERMVSPEKTRQKSKVHPAKQSAAVGSKAARAPTTTKQQPIKPGYASMRVKPSAPKHTSVIKKTTSMTFKPSESSETSSIREEVNKSDPASKKAPVKRPTSLLPPKEPVKSAKPATRPTNFELPGEAVARKLKEQRERRLAQRESSEDSFCTARQFSGPSVKSTKPLTKPDFELPGEALSRKKREAHEAKLKAQEEEERKRREFKAKPVRTSIVSTFRDTIASRARQSKVGIEGMEDGKLSVSKRSSMNVGAHRPSILELNSMANISAPRAPAPPAPIERKPSTKVHGPAMSGLAMQRTVSATEVQMQRQRAKEIYNRDQRLAEDIEREKREREAAAKRSREEAAERGRQASREWAEKQRAKKLAEGDKGMSAGYGAGGQMGLKA
jgi:hypothetical protein